MKDGKLKIGFVLDDGLDKPNGVQQYVLGLGGWLTKQGHEVHYLVGETKRSDIKNIHSLSKNIWVVFNGNKLTIPLLSRKSSIKKVLSENHFDVLHVQVPYSPIMGARVIALAGKETAVVGTFHVLPYGLLASTGSAMLGRFLRFQKNKFDKVFAVSNPAKKFAKKKFGLESFVIPNFIDTSRFTTNGNKAAKKPLRIIFVNRLVPRKGCQQLLEAVKFASQKSLINKKDIKVDICGEGWQKDKLVVFCQKNSLDNVRFYGFVSEQKKIELLSKADVAVYPSLGGESFGIVLLEAMSSGCVVLAGNNAGYRSVMSYAPESLFNPNDTKNFALKLAEIVNDEGTRQKLRNKQQQKINGFSLENIGERLLKEYFDAVHVKLKKNRQER